MKNFIVLGFYMCIYVFIFLLPLVSSFKIVYSQSTEFNKFFSEMKCDPDFAAETFKSMGMSMNPKGNLFEGLLEAGTFMQKPLGQIIINLLKKSQKSENSHYEDLAHALLENVVKEVGRRYRQGSMERPAHNQFTLINTGDINQQGLSGRTYLAHLLVISPVRSSRIGNRDGIDEWISKDISTIVSLLIKKGADPHLSDKKGLQPLHIAIAALNVEGSACLIDHGVSINRRDYTGSTPFHMLSSSIEGLNNLTSLTGKPTGKTSIDVKSDCRVRICRLFTDPKFDFNVSDGKGNTLLHKVIAHDLHLSNLLLRRGANPNAVNDLMQTPFHRACIENSSNGIEELYRFRASDKGADIFGNTALHYACSSGLEIREIQNWEEKMRENYLNNSGWSSFHFTCYFGNLETCMALLAASTSDEETALMLNTPIKTSGKTPLMIASERGHKRIVLFLLSQRGLIKYLRDNAGQMALHWAVQCEHLDIAALILDDTFVDNLTSEDRAILLHFACEADRKDQFQRLICGKWHKWGDVMQVARRLGY